MYEDDYGEDVVDLLDYTPMDFEFDYYGEDEDEWDDFDEMLDALMEDADDDDDLADFWKRKKRRRRRGRRIPKVPVASGQGIYRRSTRGRFVTQKQLGASLRRVGKDIRRNATGIKTVNGRVGRLDRRVSGVVSVNAAQNRRITRLNKTIKLDGALEFAESYNGAQLDLFSLFRGAIKSGMLDSSKGVLSNPLAVGGVGLLLNILRNNPQVLGGILAPAGGTP